MWVQTAAVCVIYRLLQFIQNEAQLCIFNIAQQQINLSLNVWVLYIRKTLIATASLLMESNW